jgi:plasmid stabilization system protein ParE
VGQELKVIFGPRARTDLTDLVGYIARGSQSSATAERFGKALVEKAVSLSTFPERGRVVPELGLAECSGDYL